jgi:hypothetical protein
MTSAKGTLPQPGFALGGYFSVTKNRAIRYARWPKRIRIRPTNHFITKAEKRRIRQTPFPDDIHEENTRTAAEATT